MNTAKISALIIITFFLASCLKNTTGPYVSLQGQWTFISGTAVFPTNSSLNYRQTYSSADHMVFGLNDTVYTNQIELVPYSNDTAFYSVYDNSGTAVIFARDSTQHGLVFKFLNTSGTLADSTNININTLTSNLLVLSFPISVPVTGSGPTTYYSGTLTDSLSK